MAVPALNKPVLLIGRENMNRAVHGDVVVVEVFDEKEWKAPADEVVDPDGRFSVYPIDETIGAERASSRLEERRCRGLRR